MAKETQFVIVTPRRKWWGKRYLDEFRVTPEANSYSRDDRGYRAHRTRFYKYVDPDTKYILLDTYVDERATILMREVPPLAESTNP